MQPSLHYSSLLSIMTPRNSTGLPLPDSRKLATVATTAQCCLIVAASSSRQKIYYACVFLDAINSIFLTAVACFIAYILRRNILYCMSTV